MPIPVGEDWWRRFFESSDSLELSYFPDHRETAREVAGLRTLLGLSPDDLIADVCCGYGRHLIPLVNQGFRVIGLDASEMMIDDGRRLLREAGLHAPLVRGDAAHLPYADGSFDVVMNLFNSFGYFIDEGQNVRVLTEFARVLKPGGRLFLDTRNREFQILYAPYCQPVTTADGQDLVMRCKYRRDKKRMESRWSLPHDPEAVVHEASIRLYGLDELKELLAAAGFEELGVYGTYQGDPFEGFRRQLLYVGRKPG